MDFLKNLMRGRGKETLFSCFIYLCAHWFVHMCTLTRNQTATLTGLLGDARTNKPTELQGQGLSFVLLFKLNENWKKLVKQVEVRCLYF